MVVEFRRRTLLPLDDVLGCLRATIPKLTRSSLHRCLERHGISRLPKNPDQPSKRGKFAATAIGYVHIDISELRLVQGKLNMFLPIDRVSKFTYVEFRDDAGKMNGADFLRGVVSAFPYAVHTVLTDNGMAFADLPKNRGRSPATQAMFGGHIFDRVCKEHGIKHKLTKPYHPWTNGQAERMNRTVKEATIKAFHYPNLESLKAHVLAFVSAYNFAKHLKAIRWKTPFEAICLAWTKTPNIFKLDPRHLIPGPNSVRGTGSCCQRRVRKMHRQERRGLFDPQRPAPHMRPPVPQQSPADLVAIGYMRKARPRLLRLGNDPELVGNTPAPAALPPRDDLDPAIQHRPYERSYDHS